MPQKNGRLYLRELLSVEIGIFLDTHYRRKAKRALVQRLTKVCSEHASQDAPVDCPE